MNPTEYMEPIVIGVLDTITVRSNRRKSEAKLVNKGFTGNLK